MTNVRRQVALFAHLWQAIDLIPMKKVDQTNTHVPSSSRLIDLFYIKRLQLQKVEQLVHRDRISFLYRRTNQLLVARCTMLQKCTLLEAVFCLFFYRNNTIKKCTFFRKSISESDHLTINFSSSTIVVIVCAFQRFLMQYVLSIMYVYNIKKIIWFYLIS